MGLRTARRCKVGGSPQLCLLSSRKGKWGVQSLRWSNRETGGGGGKGSGVGSDSGDREAESAAHLITEQVLLHADAQEVLCPCRLRMSAACLL